jgi:hypothetical protein
MNVQERRERKAKKHANYLARLKAQDEKNRGVVPEKAEEPARVEEKPEVEFIPELKFSTQPKEMTPEPVVRVLVEDSIPEMEEAITDDSKGPVEEPEPVQEEVSSEELEAPVLEGKKKKGGRKKK